MGDSIRPRCSPGMSLSSCSSQVLENVLYWSDGIALLKLVLTGNKAVVAKLKSSPGFTIFFQDIGGPLSAFSVANVRSLSLVVSRTRYVHPSITKISRFIPAVVHNSLVSLTLEVPNAFSITRHPDAIHTTLPALELLSLTDYKLPLMESVLLEIGKCKILRRLELAAALTHSVLSYTCLQPLLKDGLEYLSLITVDIGIAEVYPEYDDDPEFDENGDPIPSSPTPSPPSEVKPPHWALSMPSSLTHFKVQSIWPEIANSILLSPNLESLDLCTFLQGRRGVNFDDLLIQPLMGRLPPSVRHLWLSADFHLLFAADQLFAYLPPRLENLYINAPEYLEDAAVHALEAITFPASLKSLSINSYHNSLLNEALVARLCHQCPHLECLAPTSYESLPKALPTSLTDLSIPYQDSSHQHDYSIPAADITRLANLKRLKISYLTGDQLLHLPKNLTELLIEGSTLGLTLMKPPAEPIPFPPRLVSLSIDLRHLATPKSAQLLPVTLEKLSFSDSRLPAEWLPAAYKLPVVDAERKYSKALEFGRYLPSGLRKLVFRCQQRFIPVFNWVADLSHMERLEELIMDSHILLEQQDECMAYWKEISRCEIEQAPAPSDGVASKPFTTDLVLPDTLRQSLRVLAWNRFSVSSYAATNFFDPVPPLVLTNDTVITRGVHKSAAIPDHVVSLLFTGNHNELDVRLLYLLPSSLNALNLEGFNLVCPDYLSGDIGTLIVDALPSYLTDLSLPTYDANSIYHNSRQHRPEFEPRVMRYDTSDVSSMEE